jgi:hypothetical protein
VDRIARYPSDALRPDLPLPLPPASRVGSVLRRTVSGLREPRFADAYRAVRRDMLVIAVLVAGRFAIVGWLRPWVDVIAAVLAFGVLVRLIALTVLQRRQHVFEQQWLTAQSDVLRATSFEVVRFGVHGSAPGDYDLTRPADVRDLLARQAEERPVPVRIDFAYSPTAIETVHLDLGDVTLVPSEAARRSRVRFPDARYHGQPAMDRTGWRRPSRTTFWVLGPAAASAATPGDVTSAPRGGSVSAVQ